MGVQPIDIPAAVGLEDLLLACTTAEAGPREGAPASIATAFLYSNVTEFVIGLKGAVAEVGSLSRRPELIPAIYIRPTTADSFVLPGTHRKRPLACKGGMGRVLSIETATSLACPGAGTRLSDFGSPAVRGHRFV